MMSNEFDDASVQNVGQMIAADLTSAPGSLGMDGPMGSSATVVNMPGVDEIVNTLSEQQLGYQQALREQDFYSGSASTDQASIL